MFIPAYVTLYKQGKLADRIRQALALLESCNLCPRECHVNRLRNELGFCSTGRKARVASFNAHFGEEAALVGRRGSGTIFFSSCNLFCTFCQNYEISHFNEGAVAEAEDLARMMLALAARGCHNINLVTPTHVVPQILEALEIAVSRGLAVPLVYNTGGYDKVATLQLLDGIFDIYMPDFKFWDKAPAERYCQAPDYPEAAKAALKEMHRQTGDLVIDAGGIAERGLLVRHLVMPQHVANTQAVTAFVAGAISKRTFLNIMRQYSPSHRAKEDRSLNGHITEEEYRQAVDWAREAGITRMERE